MVSLAVTELRCKVIVCCQLDDRGHLLNKSPFIRISFFGTLQTGRSYLYSKCYMQHI